MGIVVVTVGTWIDSCAIFNCIGWATSLQHPLKHSQRLKWFPVLAEGADHQHISMLRYLLPHSPLFHLLEQCYALWKRALAVMALHESEVCHLVRRELCLFPHIRKPCHRILRPPRAAVPLDENVVGNHVGTHSIFRGHCVEHVDGSVKEASVDKAVQQAVVGEPGRLNAGEAHGLPHPQQLLGESERREAADQRGRRRRREVPQDSVPVRAQLSDELPRLAGGVGADGLPGAREGVEEGDVAAEEVLRVREEVGAVGQGAEEVERRERVRGELRGRDAPLAARARLHRHLHARMHPVQAPPSFCLVSTCQLRREGWWGPHVS